jgi:hypothetical protein
MAQAWKEWLEQPEETDSAWMREYRTRALAELERRRRYIEPTQAMPASMGVYLTTSTCRALC